MNCDLKKEREKKKKNKGQQNGIIRSLDEEDLSVETITYK